MPSSTPESRQSLEFVQRLRQRQLFRLAEVYCRQQLQVPHSEADQTELVVQLLESLSGRALAQRDLDDSSLWDQARDVGDDYQRRWRASLAGYTVGLHTQRIELARAGWLLAAADLDPHPELRKQRAIEVMRSVARALEELDGEIAQRMRSPAVNADVDDARQLLQLRHQVQFTLGQAYSRHADCAADRSPDRIHLLTQALQQFASLARLHPPSELSWQSRLQEIDCQRRLRNFQAMRQRLAEFPSEQISAAVARQRTILQAKLEIDEGNPREAVELLLGVGAKIAVDDDVDGWAEAMLTLVEAYVTLAKQADPATDNQDSRNWHSLALAAVEQLEQQASTYWVRRAEAVLSVQPRQATGTTQLEILTRTAANFYRRKHYSDAQVAYQRAADLAGQLGLQDQAFMLGLRAAAVLRQTSDHARAGAEFAQLATQHPHHPRAAQAHWLAITHAAQRARQDPGLLPEYQRLLAEHLERWPESDWSDDVRFWYGRLLRQQGELEAARQQWQAVRPGSARFGAALSELRQTYHQQLNGLSLEDPARKSLAQQALSAFTSWRDAMTAQSKADPPLVWDVALSAAEFGLLYDVLPADTALELTRSIGPLEQGAQSFPDRVYALQGLRDVLAGQSAEAARAWDRVDWNRYDYPLPLVTRLIQQPAAQPANEPRSDTLGQIECDWIQRLLATERWKADARLRVWGATVLAGRGQRQQALTLFRQLLEESPHDLATRVALADLVEQGGTADDYREALDHWRTAVRLAPVDSASWFRAKLGIARNLLQLNQRQRSVEAIRLLQALHPELGGPRWQSQFLDLLRRAEAEPR